MVSKYMTKQAKKLVQEKGVLSSPNPKAGKSLSKSTEEQVVSIYRSDDISLFPYFFAMVHVDIECKWGQLGTGGPHRSFILQAGNLKKVFQPRIYIETPCDN